MPTIYRQQSANVVTSKAGAIVMGISINILLSLSAFAQQTGERPKGPPPEALAACKSLASGASCTFQGRRGSVTGTCEMPRQGTEMACRPQNARAPEGAASGSKR